MLDSYSRKIVARTLGPISGWLARLPVDPLAITAIGLGFGVAGCIAVAFGHWWLGLGFWLSNRTFDGLDGLVARRLGTTEFGAFADIISDFVVYSGFVVAVAYRLPESRLAAIVLLMTYYVSGAAFLAWSDLSARSVRNISQTDERSLNFLPGVAEGTETIVVYSLLFVVPERAVQILWVFAAMVGFTALQRIWWAKKTFS